MEIGVLLSHRLWIHWNGRFFGMVVLGERPDLLRIFTLCARQTFCTIIGLVCGKNSDKAWLLGMSRSECGCEAVVFLTLTSTDGHGRLSRLFNFTHFMLGPGIASFTALSRRRQRFS